MIERAIGMGVWNNATVCRSSPTHIPGQAWCFAWSALAAAARQVSWSGPKPCWEWAQKTGLQWREPLCTEGGELAANLKGFASQLVSTPKSLTRLNFLSLFVTTSQNLKLARMDTRQAIQIRQEHDSRNRLSVEAVKGSMCTIRWTRFDTQLTHPHDS